MKLPMRILVRLYPSWWRQRYGSEFEALLEELKPGPGELWDVLKGALAMQMKTLATIPVVCVLLGALAGGFIAMQTPVVFASTATIRVNAGENVSAESIGEVVRASLDNQSSDVKGATSVRLMRGDQPTTILHLTYQNPDPQRARRVAKDLADAVVTENPGRAEVLNGPSLSTAPIHSGYTASVASGAGVGLVAGGLVVLALRSRKRPSSAD